MGRLIKGLYTDAPKDPYRAKLYLETDDGVLRFEIDEVHRVEKLPRRLTRLDDDELAIAGKELQEIRKGPESEFFLQVAGFGFVLLFTTIVLNGELTRGLNFLREEEVQDDQELLDFYGKDSALVEL